MISDKHLEEWCKGSAVSRTIAELNVCTLTDNREIDKVLDRNTKRRWKHTDWGEGGWWVAGVDPITGESRGIGGQFKPDISPDPDRKYFNISDTAATPLFLDTGDRNYWREIIDHGNHVIITEGAKKAGAGLTVGLPTISIPGVTAGQKLGRLRQDLLPFFKVGKRVYLCFDSDVMTKQPVQQALDRLGRLIAETGANVSVINLPSDTKGMDDFIVNHGDKAFHELLESAATFEEWRDSIKNSKELKPKSFKRQILETIRKRYGKRLRLNAMSKNVEMDGIAIKPDYLYLELLEEDISASKDFISDTFYYLAQQNQYHPVQDYLKACQRRYGTSTIHLLENPSQRYIGTTETLYDVFIRKTLIAAVARTFSPGCKVDTALILQGEQGKRKSTFFKVLAGDWFDDSMSCNTTDKDEKLKLHATWFMEWAELETIFSRKDVSATKAFLSSSVDKFRAPFGRTTDNFPRHSIIVGTTNSDDFLQDSTGSRRFWVLPIPKNGSLDIDLLREERDKLWAAAITAYERGDQWWLTNEEESLNGNINQQFQRDDSWTNTISDYISIHSQVSIKDVLADALGVTIDRQDRAMQMRVADILRFLGWVKKHTERGKVWVRKEGKGSQVVINETEKGLQDDYLMTTSTNGSQLTALTTSPDPQILLPTEKNGVVSAKKVDIQGIESIPDYLTQKNDHFKESFLENNKNEKCQFFTDQPSPKYKKVEPSIGATCAFKDRNVLVLDCTIIKDLGMKYYKPRQNLQVLYKVQMPNQKTKQVFECDLQCYAESPDGEDLLELLGAVTKELSHA